MCGGERAGSMAEALPTLECVRASWASSQGLSLLPHRRSFEAQKGPRREVCVAGRAPASLQTPQQQADSG